MFECVARETESIVLRWEVNVECDDQSVDLNDVSNVTGQVCAGNAFSIARHLRVFFWS